MRTKTVTKLDPSYKVHHSSISSDHEEMLYFDELGRRIPLIEVEEKYVPEYDVESGKLGGTWARHEIELFRDVFIRVGTLRSRWHLMAQIKMLVVWRLDKHLLRHFGYGTDTRTKSTE